MDNEICQLAAEYVVKPSIIRRKIWNAPYIGKAENRFNQYQKYKKAKFPNLREERQSPNEIVQARAARYESMDAERANAFDEWVEENKDKNMSNVVMHGMNNESAVKRAVARIRIVLDSAHKAGVLGLCFISNIGSSKRTEIVGSPLAFRCFQEIVPGRVGEEMGFDAWCAMRFNSSSMYHAQQGLPIEQSTDAVTRNSSVKELRQHVPDMLRNLICE